ncbi:collagen alpha-1(I) chain-like [Pan paniscus]|uniref:collagen alpha-1(I) chain-like n=1 Tax=Pan paniscus TaxID=9597 RepID=UPI001560D1B2|nr:collagen alpha-1(I) chain-like [Pan paniscus]
MVPAAQRLPHQPGDAEGAEPRGVSPPGVGSSSETGDKCPAPPSAARGLHHLLAQSRGAGRECGRRGREKGWGGGGEAEARSWSPGGRRLPPPRGPAPPPGASSAALGGVPAGAARPAAAPQARARRAAAEAVCNRQLLQPREESRDRREEPGRRRGARRRNTQAPPSSPPSPGGEGAVRGEGRKGEAGGRARSPAPAAGPPPDCGERGWERASATAAAAAAERGSLLPPYPAPCTPLGFGRATTPPSRPTPPASCRQGFLARGSSPVVVLDRRPPPRRLPLPRGLGSSEASPTAAVRRPRRRDLLGARPESQRAAPMERVDVHTRYRDDFIPKRTQPTLGETQSPGDARGTVCCRKSGRRETQPVEPLSSVISKEGIPGRGRGERGTNDNFKFFVIPNGLEVTSLKK